MAITKLIGSGLQGIKTRLERASLRRQLLDREDRILEDMGISRRLLEQGVRAWPWREEVAENEREPNRHKQAIKDRRLYDAAEIVDLGLRRSKIGHAVRYGRPGVDRRSIGA